MGCTNIQVKDRQEAFDVINEMYPLTYNKDERSTENAGYPIYRSEEEYYSYICDLGCRLELNLASGETVNFYWKKPNFNYTVSPRYTQRHATFRQYH